jgi:hypothetical protein
MALGALTMVYGKLDFAEMAVDLALSYKAHNPTPISCVADPVTSAFLMQRYPGVFERIIPLPGRYGTGRKRKYSVCEASPYDVTLYLDADTLVTSTLRPLWEQLTDVPAPVTMLGEHLTLDDDRNHHGFSTRDIMGDFRLSCYLKTNSGCFGFRESVEANAFFEECCDVFDELEAKGYRQRGWLGDEIAIGIVGGLHRTRFFSGPCAMTWPDDLAALRADGACKPLCHLIGPVPREAMEWLCTGMVSRREHAGLPVRGVQAWRKLNDEYHRRDRPPSIAEKLIFRLRHLRQLGLTRHSRQAVRR